MADTKLADLTADASPTGDDLVYVVNDPGGTPADRKVTLTNLARSVAFTSWRQIVVKSADESVTSSTTAQDDDALRFSIAANENWVARFAISYEADGTADIKFGVSVPSGATFRRLVVGPAASAAGDPANDARFVSTDSATANGFGGIGAGSAQAALMEIFVDNGANAGEVILQWAQVSSSATASKVHAGSYLVADRVS